VPNPFQGLLPGSTLSASFRPWVTPPRFFVLSMSPATRIIVSTGMANGAPGSIFGQVSFCNARAFFEQANAAIAAGKLKVPDLGTAADGKVCPTTRDWSVVDQDPSDNVTASYLVTARGQVAQNTPENAKKLAGANPAKNGSDEGLLAIRLASALKCTPMMAPDLTSPSHPMVTALPLNELQAAAKQAAPQALVPSFDPMTMVNGNRSLSKLNLYRSGVDQPAAPSLSSLNTTFCRNLVSLGLPRLAGERKLLQAAPTPDPAQATNLFTFLAMRAQNTMQDAAGFLRCTKLLNIKNPITLKTNAAGVVVDATIALKGAPGPKMAAAVEATEAATETAPGTETPVNPTAKAANAAAALVAAQNGKPQPAVAQ